MQGQVPGDDQNSHQTTAGHQGLCEAPYVRAEDTT